MFTTNNGFSLIEVLVATILLAMSIFVSSVAYKQYISAFEKQKKIERVYITALSLLNMIKRNSVNPFYEKSGRLNGLTYNIVAKRVVAKRNYEYFSTHPGNKGRFLVSLYRVVISIEDRRFVFFKTQYKKLH